MRPNHLFDPSRFGPQQFNIALGRPWSPIL
jgi:hypothetical protein